MSFTAEIKELKELISDDIEDVEHILYSNNSSLKEEKNILYKIVSQRIDKLNIRSAILQFKYNDYNTSILKYPAKSGRVYIFPHWLEHEVEPIMHDKTRVSISWNIRIPQLLGCGYGCTNG